MAYFTGLGRSVLAVVMVTLGLFLGGWHQLAAQIDAKRPQATRQELESAYSQLSTQQRTYADAVALRERLDQGDFQIGDRIVLLIRGDTSLSNTFTVSGNRTLELPNIGSVPLQGVLRSELEDHLRVVIAKFIRNVDLHAESLIRISVTGQVTKPGFYNVPATALLGDVFTAGGGLTPVSDVGKTEVRRGGQQLLAADKVQRAITEGRTLDQMNLHSGDELLVPEQKKGRTASTVLLIGSIAAALLSIVAVVALVSK